jgi:uncharacterized protein VirK/YbjX
MNGHPKEYSLVIKKNEVAPDVSIDKAFQSIRQNKQQASGHPMWSHKWYFKVAFLHVSYMQNKFSRRIQKTLGRTKIVRGRLIQPCRLPCNV